MSTLAGFHGLSLLRLAALRTMPVVAGMIAVAKARAARTLEELAAQGRGAAGQDLLQDLPVPSGHGGAKALPVFRGQPLEPLMNGQTFTTGAGGAVGSVDNIHSMPHNLKVHRLIWTDHESKSGVAVTDTSRNPQLKHLPEVGVIVDVGVAKGTPWLYERWPDAELHLIDPTPIHAEVNTLLRDRPRKVHEVALGESTGSAKFNVNLDVPSLSSLLARTPLTVTKHRYTTVEVPMVTLDSMIPEIVGRSKPRNVGLKVDTEGYELHVIRGAKEILKHCAFVICEVSVKKRFFESYSFEEMILLMSENSFKVDSIVSAPFDP